jgi:hypothetical protein
LKKRSASNDSPPDLTYFIDRDLGRYQFPDALEAAGLRIERYATHFPDTALDEDWLPVVGRRGWVALSHDRRISRNSLQTAVSMRAGVRLFILRGKVPTPTLAQNFLMVESRVRLMVSRNTAPFIAKVYLAKDSTRKELREAVQMYLTAGKWANHSG